MMDFFRNFDKNVGQLAAPAWEEFKLILDEHFYSIIYFALATLPFALLLVLVQDHWDIDHPQPIGCKRIGLRGSSNLKDEQDSKYNGQPTAETTKVKALFLYPVKSCKPVEVEEAEIIRTGVRYDRQFSFAQLEDKPSPKQGDDSTEPTRQWRFVTQRTFPRLALVNVQLWVPDESSRLYNAEREVSKNGGCLIISFPLVTQTYFSLRGLGAVWNSIKSKYISGSTGVGPMVTFEVPFLPTVERMQAKQYGPMENMVIWKDDPAAINMENEIPPGILEKLKAHLGVKNPLTLFRVDTSNYREVFRCAPRKEEIGYQPIVGFADAYPLHMLGIASVQDLAHRLPAKDREGFSAIRFRSNIIVAGPSPNAEQDWQRIRIGDREYHVSCRTIRCKLPNVDPANGVPDRNEPYTTLTKYRCIDEGCKNMPALGMQMVPINGEPGVIRVGDEIEVLQTGPHRYIKQ